MGTRSKKKAGVAVDFHQPKATPWEEYQTVFGGDEAHFHASAIVWCLHCERAYPLRDMVKAEDLWWCKYYPDCDGSMLDTHSWGWVRESNPGYPEIPEEGRYYGHYGER